MVLNVLLDHTTAQQLWDSAAPEAPRLESGLDSVTWGDPKAREPPEGHHRRVRWALGAPGGIQANFHFGGERPLFIYPPTTFRSWRRDPCLGTRPGFSEK
jgi:hypothetical protein